jgi:hypothetical protein
MNGAGLVPDGWGTSKTSVNCRLIQLLANFKYLTTSANLAQGQRRIGEKAS